MEYQNFEPSKIQDKQILQLCKRLNQFTLDEITTITELEQEEIKPILDELVKENHLSKFRNIYKFNKKPQTVSQGRIERKNLNLMFEFRTQSEQEIIIKGFCLEIPPQKLCELINLKKNCICQYYAIFRKLIYEKQFEELLKNYELSPQIGRYRKFYNKLAYFYVYDNKVFVSNKLLKSEKQEKEFTKAEIQIFKNTYCFVSRLESHNVNERYMYYRLAEYIWRRNKKHGQLYENLKNLLNRPISKFTLL